MNLYLSNAEVNIIATALKDKPWSEVNGLMSKLSAIPAPVESSVESSIVKDAPYGLKKDGTPRARPGRKSAKRKTRQ